MLKKDNNMMRQRIAEERTRLYRVALAWCGDPATADDLVQETMATGIDKYDQLRDEQRLYAWLYSILNNAWHSLLRKRRNDDTFEDQVADSVTGPCNTCEEMELINSVRSTVMTLPVIERQVITLVDLGGLSYCDVAQSLDIPIGTVMSRLHRARKHLLDRIEQQAVVLTNRQTHIKLVE